MAVKQCTKCKMSFADQLQECPYCGTASRSSRRRSQISSPNWAKSSDSKKATGPQSGTDLNTPWKPENYEAVDYRRTFLLLLLLVVSALAYMMYDLVTQEKGADHARMEWCAQHCQTELKRESATNPNLDAPRYMGTCRSNCLNEHGFR